MEVVLLAATTGPGMGYLHEAKLCVTPTTTGRNGAFGMSGRVGSRIGDCCLCVSNVLFVWVLFVWVLFVLFDRATRW